MGGFQLIIYNEKNPLTMDYIKAFMIQNHRGPDDSNMLTISSEIIHTNSKFLLTKHKLQTYILQNYTFLYKKLNIHDSTYNSLQPFEDPIKSNLVKYPDLKKRPLRYLMANGEIYNYKNLKKDNQFTDKDLLSDSDVEIIMPMYIKHGIDNTLNNLVGDFSFVILDNPKTYFYEKETRIIAAKDIFGTKSMYHVLDNLNNTFIFVSELKSLPISLLENKSYKIQIFPPASYYCSLQKRYINYFQWELYKNFKIITSDPNTLDSIYKSLQTLFFNSIIDTIDLSLNFGILLSNGFGSILLTAVIVDYLYTNNYNNIIHLFSINTEDFNYARDFVFYLENKYNIVLHHHNVSLIDKDIIQSDLDDIIYTLETNDLEVITQAIPMYYLLKYIKEFCTDVKILYTGDFLNLYSNGDSPELIQKNSITALKNLYKTSLLRTDKISNRWSFQIRHPYLNKDLITYILQLHPKFRTKGYWSIGQEIDKYMFRKSFQKDVLGYELIPDKFLWVKSSSFSESIKSLNFNLIEEICNEIYLKFFKRIII